MKAILEIQQNKKLTMIPIIGAVLVIILSLVLNVNKAGFGIIILIFGIANKELKIIKLYPQHLQIQLAVTHPKKIIQYKQITSFSIVSRGIIIFYDTENNVPKKIHVEYIEKKYLLKLDKMLQEKAELESSDTTD